MAKLALFVLALVSLALCGCPYISSVHTSCQVTKLPDMAAVKKMIAAYPEVSHVDYRRCDGGRPLTLTGLRRPRVEYRFTYEGGNEIRGHLYFVEDNQDGHFLYLQGVKKVRRKVPTAWIKATLPIMRRIQKDLIEKHGMTEIPPDLEMDYINAEPPAEPKTKA